MSIVIMILLLSVLILVHEAGHFGVARFFKIPVERFGFGLPFGPTLYEGKWGETKVFVHAFLLGGYVSFPDDDPDCELAEDDPNRFNNRPIYQRFCVIAAGVFANFVTAIAIVFFVAFVSGSLPTGKYDVAIKGLFKDPKYASHKAGILPNDKIVSVNGLKIDSPYKFKYIIAFNKKFNAVVSNERLKEQKKAVIDLNKNLKLDSTKVIPAGQKVLIPSVKAESPVTIENDGIASIEHVQSNLNKLSSEQIKLRDKLENKKEYIGDGKTTLNDLVYATADTYSLVNIVVDRKGSLVKLPAVYPDKDGMLGVELSYTEIPAKTTGLISGTKNSLKYIYDNTYYMVYGLKLLFTGKIKTTELHGIVAITKVGGDVIAQRGLADGLLLTALISINLAIVNLLPIPALDGGHLMFLLIEKIKGRPIRKETVENISQVFFLILIVLMLLIIFNDIFGLVTNQY